MFFLRSDHCLVPKKEGPCRGSFARWHYNAATEQCEEFKFGGCKPNRNNYLALNECENACDKVSGIVLIFLFMVTFTNRCSLITTDKTYIFTVQSGGINVNNSIAKNYSKCKLLIYLLIKV